MASSIQRMIEELGRNVAALADEMLMRPGPGFAGGGGDLSDLLPLFQGLCPDLVGGGPGPTDEGGYSGNRLDRLTSMPVSDHDGKGMRCHDTSN